MAKKKVFRTIQVLEKDYLAIKRWSAQRDMKMFEIISALVAK